MDLTVSVSYGDDLPKVKEIRLDAAKNIEDLTDNPIALFFNKSDGSSINLVLML